MAEPTLTKRIKKRRKVLVTGVTRGLGRALADRLVERGHIVTGCGRSAERIDDLKAGIPAPHRFDVVDVSNGDEVLAWAAELLRVGEAPDLLINNAGVMNRRAPLWLVPEDEFANLMRINVGGMANVIRAFLPAMIERGSGVVINMSSGWGRSAAPEVAPYCASKWAIEGLTQALSQELPSGLAAVAVNPGIIDTDMLRSCWDESAGGFPSPKEWSNRAADFLLSLTQRDNGKSLSV